MDAVWAMSSTHLSIHLHLVFSTKSREPWFAPEMLARVHSYMGGVIRQMNAVPNAIGGVADHVHLAVGLRATHYLPDVMRELKSESSRWVHQELGLAGFSWQEGYGAFSFAATSLEKVRRYIQHQEEHHRTTSFKEEYVKMLRRGMVEYDERYLW